MLTVARGGSGKDTLTGGPGRDELYGNLNAHLTGAKDTESDYISCGDGIFDGADTAIIDGADTTNGCEQLIAMTEARLQQCVKEDQ